MCSGPFFLPRWWWGRPTDGVLSAMDLEDFIPMRINMPILFGTSFAVQDS